MTKSFFLLISMVSILLMREIYIFPVEAIEVSVPEVSGTPGSTIVVPINVDDAAGIAGVDITLTLVTIRIYNSVGQLIKMFNLGYKSAGFYTSKQKAAYWDGKNEAGEKVASGIYFYTIHAGNFTSTKRMILVK